jgi:hypothetical protein
MKSYELYAKQRVATFPCHRNKKPATPNGFYDASFDVEELRKMFSSEKFLPGIPTGNVNGIVVIDIDNKDYMSVDDCYEYIEQDHGPLPDTLTVQTQGGGIHLYYRIDQPTKTKTASRFLNKMLPVDIRSNGGYVIAPDGSGLYSPIDVEDDDFWTDLRALCAPLPEWIEGFQKYIEEIPRNVETLPEREILEIRSALSYIESDDYDTWIRVGQCLRSTNSPSGFHLWDEWSKKSDKYESEVMEAKWRSFDSVSELTIASLFHEAKKNGWVSTYKNNSQPVEISTEIGEDEIDEQENHRKEPFPNHLLNPPGIVGELINHINKYSIKKQPILALGASLSACGAVMGQRYQTDQGLRTNIYVLGVGESGCGKDAARSAIKRLFDNAGIGEWAGTEDLASDSAVLTALSETPSQVMLIDEMGRFLNTTNQATARNSHLYNIVSILLKVYSSSNQKFRGKSYADSQNKKVVESPNLCIYGTTVPNTLFESLTVENITDGFLSRFMIFESEDPDPARSGRRKLALQKVDEKLVQKIREIVAMPRNVEDEGNIDKAEKVKPQVVEMTTDAEELCTGYEEFIHNKRKDLRDKEIIETVYNRAPQFAEQIALIIAVGRNYKNPIIEFDDMQYAIELTNYLTDRMCFIAMHYISRNDLEKNYKKVLNMVRSYGKKGMTKREFTRKTQFLNKYLRDDILESLMVGGQVKIVADENGQQLIYPIKDKE